MRLATPLRSTKIVFKGDKRTGKKMCNLPQGGSPPGKADLLSEGAQWDAAWEISDEIYAKQTEDDSSCE